SPNRISAVRMSRVLKVCVAGATGWTGSAIVKGVVESPDLELGSCVSRSGVGKTIEGAPVYGRVDEALNGIDVLVDYTSATAVNPAGAAAKAAAPPAIGAGVAVVVDSPALSAAEFDEIDAPPRARKVGVIAAGNFPPTAAMCQAAALLAARHLPQWEVIDYA